MARKRRLLRAVGRAEDRLREDALRALRALRFTVTKGFHLDSELFCALDSDWLPPVCSSARWIRLISNLATSSWRSIRPPVSMQCIDSMICSSCQSFNASFLRPFTSSTQAGSPAGL